MANHRIHLIAGELILAMVAAVAGVRAGEPRYFATRNAPIVPVSDSYHVNRRLHGWLLPPLVICAIGAH